MNFSLECTQLLQNDFFKQRYITLNAIIPGQDRIYPNTNLCRTFLLGIYIKADVDKGKCYQTMDLDCDFP